MSDFAARIRAARAWADLSQEQLAEQLGTTAQTIKRREAGTQQPKRGELLAIAAICGVPSSFMEHGFGEVDRDEVVERLDRIEALLLDESDVAPGAVRDYARGAIRSVREGEGSGESPAPTPLPARGPRKAAAKPPRAPSRERS